MRPDTRIHNRILGNYKNLNPENLKHETDKTDNLEPEPIPNLACETQNVIQIEKHKRSKPQNLG